LACQLEINRLRIAEPFWKVDLRFKMLWLKPMNVIGKSMAPQSNPFTSWRFSVDLIAGLFSVVRQPILDLRGRVHAYELHYRGGLSPDGVSLSTA